MALIDLKTDLSKITKPSDVSPTSTHEKHTHQSILDIDSSPPKTNQAVSQLINMTSDLATNVGVNLSQIGGRHGGTMGPTPATPPLDPDHSIYDSDSTPYLGIGNPNLFGIDNSTDAPTFINTSNPHPISLSVIDNFSGRQGEWGPGTLPLGFTTNHQSSELAPTNILPSLTPLSWNVSSITSTHPFGSNGGFSFDLSSVTDYVSDLQLGSQGSPQLYPIGIENVDPLIPNDTSLHTITNPSTYNPITVTFDNTQHVPENIQNSLYPIPHNSHYGGEPLTTLWEISNVSVEPNPMTQTFPATPLIENINTGVYPINPTNYSGDLGSQIVNLYTITNPIFNGHPSYYSYNTNVTFNNVPSIDDSGIYTVALHPTSNDSTITREGEFGSSLLLKFGNKTKYPNNLGVDEFSNTAHLTGANNNSLYPFYTHQSDYGQSSLHQLLVNGTTLEFSNTPHIEGAANDSLYRLQHDSHYSTNFPEGTTLHNINAINVTPRYTFPVIPTNPETERKTQGPYGFSTQFGYYWNEAYDQLYGNKINFRIRNENPLTSPLGASMTDFGTTTTNNNYGYHSLQRIPKDMNQYSDTAQYHSFDTIGGIATRYKGLHTAYTSVSTEDNVPIGLYPYLSQLTSEGTPTDWGNHTVDPIIPALVSRNTGLHSILTRTITPSYTFPNIPPAEETNDDGTTTTLSYSTVGPFLHNTSTYSQNLTAGLGSPISSKLQVKFEGISGEAPIPGYSGDSTVTGNWNYNKYLSVPQAYMNGGSQGVTANFNTAQTTAQAQATFNLSDFISGLQTGNYGSKADGYKNLRDSVYTKAKGPYGDIEWKSHGRNFTGPVVGPKGLFYAKWDVGSEPGFQLGDANQFTDMPIGKTSSWNKQPNSRFLPVGSTVLALKTLTRTLGKPHGIAWMAWQFAAHLMNPRGETRIWNFLSPLVSAVPMFHMNRHFYAQVPAWTKYGKKPAFGVGPSGGMYHTYSEGKDVKGIEQIKENAPTDFNRLVNLRNTKINVEPPEKGGFAKFLEFLGIGGPPGVNSSKGPFGQNDMHQNLPGAPKGNTDLIDKSYSVMSYTQINNIAKQKKDDYEITFNPDDGKYTVKNKDSVNYEQFMEQEAVQKGEDNTTYSGASLQGSKHFGHDSANKSKWHDVGSPDDNIFSALDTTTGRRTINRNADTSNAWKNNSHDAINKLGVLTQRKENTYGVTIDNNGNIDKLGGKNLYNMDTIPFVINFFSLLDPVSGLRNSDGQLHRFYLPFRCTVTSITDNNAASWNPTRFIGRPDKVYVYQGHDRVIQMTLTVAATSKQEMKPMWEKVNALMGLTSPDMTKFSSDIHPGIRMVAPICRVTLGDYFNNTPMILNSVNSVIDDKYTWEIDEGMRMPQQIQLGLSWQWIGDEFPRMGNHYVDYDRDGGVYQVSSATDGKETLNATAFKE